MGSRYIIRVIYIFILDMVVLLITILRQFQTIDYMTNFLCYLHASSFYTTMIFYVKKPQLSLIINFFTRCMIVIDFYYTNNMTSNTSLNDRQGSFLEGTLTKLLAIEVGGDHRLPMFSSFSSHSFYECCFFFVMLMEKQFLLNET